ncbi:hypothetical protein OAX78_01190 [Planctomycetota bacterium]|nr:hypothetical protein [Planctomycetota bacterium]
MNRHTLYWWNQQIAKRDRQAKRPAAAKLVPVEVRGGMAGVLGVSSDLEVALRVSGHVVRVPGGFDAATLTRLVATLEQQ